jgi:hypothetical protein
MMNRRAFVASLMASLSAAPCMVSAQRVATPESHRPVVDVVTFRVHEELWQGVELDHYRVVDLASQVGDGVAVLGALVNTGPDPVDVPFLIDVALRDPDEVIVDSTFLDPVYPILPPNTPIGFGAFFTSTRFTDVDPALVRFDVDPLTKNTGEVERLQEYSLEMVSAEEVSRSDRNLVIECLVKNTSDHVFDGLRPQIAVWDVDGLYCGDAYANVFTTIRPGESIRFETLSSGSIPNPLDLAGDDFTWEPWIAPL